jgi:hypothetical protein
LNKFKDENEKEYYRDLVACLNISLATPTRYGTTGLPLGFYRVGGGKPGDWMQIPPLPNDTQRLYDRGKPIEVNLNTGYLVYRLE